MTWPAGSTALVLLACAAVRLALRPRAPNGRLGSRQARRTGTRGAPRPRGTARRAVDPARLAATVTAVAAELRAGRAPGEAWRAVLGVAVPPDGVPLADDVLAALTHRAPGRPRQGGAGGGARGGARRGVRYGGPGGRGRGGRDRVERDPVGQGRVGRDRVGRDGGARGRGAGRGRVVVRAGARGDVLLAGRVHAVLAATRLAIEVGAPLASVLDGAARSLAADAEAETALRAALAGPRQTTALLTALPLLGLLLGSALGADPVGVLTGGGLGTTSGVLGIVLTLVGRAWVGRMVAATRAAGAGRELAAREVPR